MEKHLQLARCQVTEVMFGNLAGVGYDLDVSAAASILGTPFVLSGIKSSNTLTLRKDNITKGSGLMANSADVTNLNGYVGNANLKGNIYFTAFGAGEILINEIRKIEKYAAKLAGVTI